MRHMMMRLSLAAWIVACALGVLAIDRSEASVQDTHQTFLPIAVAQTRGEMPASIFGLQLYCDTGPDSTYFSAQMQTGANWIRVPFWWRRVEPENVAPADYIWSAVDQNASGANHGFDIIGVIDEFPDWAATNRHGPVDLVPMAEYTSYLRAVVERYDGDGVQDAPGSPVVRYWEITNEPDRRENWGAIPGEYAEFLALTTATIKEANPNAQVLFGGIAFDWFEPHGPFVYDFLDDVLAAGACADFDIMNFHAYPSFADNWASYGPGLVEKAAVIDEIVADHCGASRPTMVTELGWHSNANEHFPDNNPEIQARYVVQLGAQSKAAGLESMIWWMLYDPEPTYPYRNGLVTDTAEPKPALVAYSNMVAELSTAQYVRKLSTAETGAPELEAHLFDDPRRARTLYVAWANPVDASGSRTLRLRAPALVQRTMYGAATTLRDADDGSTDGWVTVSVGAAPVYLDIER